MKVLFVCEGLRATTARAQPWRHVIEISRRIQGLGNAVSDAPRKTNVDDEIQGVSIKRVVKKGLSFDMDKLTRSICEEDVDIINWHGSDTWSSYYLWRIRRELVDVVWTLHSGPLSTNDLRNLRIRDAVELYRYWNNILNAILPSFIVRKWMENSRIKRVITLSKRLSKHLRSLQVSMGRSCTSVIPSGVDTTQFKPASQEKARQDLGLWSDDPILMYYGPISSFRGVDTLLNAMSFLGRQIPSVKLLLLGRGPSDNVGLNKYRDEASIRFVSQILTQDEIVQYLAAVDVVVLPFRFWPQVECPLTILESMAMEKAVVATSTGAIPEIISSGRNGILVPPGNPMALAQRVTELLQSSEMRMRIGRNARLHVERYYDWNEIVRRTLKVFKEALMEQ
jgi:glycosyltransferase involved in cell wall biosynthesis